MDILAEQAFFDLISIKTSVKEDHSSAVGQRNHGYQYQYFNTFDYYAFTIYRQR